MYNLLTGSRAYKFIMHAILSFSHTFSPVLGNHFTTLKKYWLISWLTGRQNEQLQTGLKPQLEQRVSLLGISA